ncbi:alpha/beta hydrolase [Pseudomarimonas arenosa]|uniref:Alpha/beta hydrolase n=1 Tax=Pseudomarimonas arenosa TaxID=2774145 RepID=A0AAW3ZM50_9GAMM|nr:alpha/beta fold hydrolase [Pseudomarimonas arenosa]MBD8527205.1 alpha/beta hydrolase [Pseudomarimonas arenosa]
MRRFLLSTLKLVAMAYLLFLALLFMQQRAMMFPGVALQSGTGHVPTGASNEIALPASFGQVKAWWLEAERAEPPSAAVLYFHGNYELAEHSIELLKPLNRLGLHVLLIEYPGYAGSDGAPSRDSLREAARVGYDWLAAQPQVDTERIIAMGRSIGTGPASELSLDRPLRAIVLLSPFTAIRDFAWRMLAPPLLIRDPFDNRAALRQFSGPVLLFHGRDDEIIPFAHSQALLAAADRAELIEMPGGHNDAPYFEAAFMRQLQAFLQREAVLPAD